MRAVSFLLVVLTLTAPFPGAQGHTFSKTCTFPLGNTAYPAYPDQADVGLFSILHDIAPNALPEGITHCLVPGVEGGDMFQLTYERHVLVVGTADECPGPRWRGALTDAVLRGDVNEAVRIVAEDFWLLCNHAPEVTIRFTAGDAGNGPGDEPGTVPGSGDAMIYMLFGKPGATVTYSEG